jgi:gluconate 2-dehydrogenase gamma chain
MKSLARAMVNWQSHQLCLANAFARLLEVRNMEMPFDAGYDRRELLQRITLLIGSASLIPSDALAAAKPRRKVASAMTPLQLAAFTAIADTIIPKTDTPGAVQAGVPRQYEKLLSTWASPTRKAALLGAINEIDAMAMANDKKKFAALTPARRKELMLAHDKAALMPGPPSKEKPNAFAAMTMGPPVANPAYVKMKELIILLYYASETAMTQELVYEHNPGKYVPSLPVTTSTRPFSGLGGLLG